MRAAAPIRRQLGLSIIELMISLTLSLVVLSALIYVYVTSRGTYRGNEAVARIQENGRFAMDWLSREIRSAGYFGCVSRGLTWTVIAKDFLGTSWGGLQGIRGSENGADWTAPLATQAPTNYQRGDVLYLSGMYGTAANVTDNHSNNANMKADRCIGLTKNDLVLATNCASATIGRITNNVSCSGALGAIDSNGFYDVTLAGGTNTMPFKTEYTKSNRSILYKFFAYAYYIGTNPAGRPALYRTSADANGNVIPTEEVVENIENMDLLFGEDADGDGYADVYRPASAVASWDRVVSVRVTLVAVSPEAGATAQAQTYYFGANSDGTAIGWQTSNDRRLRQVFTSTVALRNLLP